MRMKGEVLDLLLLEILRREWLEWHAVIAHALWPMFAHLEISGPSNFAILAVEPIIEW